MLSDPVFTGHVSQSLNHQLNKSTADRTWEVIGAGVIVPVGPINLLAGATTMLDKKSEHETSYSLGFAARF